MTGRGDLEAIKVQLQDRVVDVCERLLPGGMIEGRRLYVAHDPVQGDHDHKPALKVRLTGNVGGWRNFRGGDETARHDLVGLVEYILRTDTKGALAWAREFLGIRNMSRTEREAMQLAARARALKRQHDTQTQYRKNIERAERLWRTATLPMKAGAMPAPAAHALAYFAGRGCPLDQVPALSDYTFRFAFQSEYWTKAKWANRGDGYPRKETAGPLYPAVHSAMRTQHGIVTACHVTFLDPIRPAKAPEEPAKLIRGEAATCVIEISTGPSGVPFWLWREDQEPDDVIVCEGIETGLSLAIAAPEARVWAAGSISNIGNVPVHLPIVGRIIVGRDNNIGNATAQKQLDQALDKLEAAGKPLVVMASHVGDDFNDLMQGE